MKFDAVNAREQQWNAADVLGDWLMERHPAPLGYGWIVVPTPRRRWSRAWLRPTREWLQFDNDDTTEWADNAKWLLSKVPGASGG